LSKKSLKKGFTPSSAMSIKDPPPEAETRISWFNLKSIKYKKVESIEITSMIGHDSTPEFSPDLTPVSIKIAAQDFHTDFKYAPSLSISQSNSRTRL
jgi:hypothetical protein